MRSRSASIVVVASVLALACAGLEEEPLPDETGSPVDLASTPRQTVPIQTGPGERLQALAGSEIAALMTGNSLVGAYTGSNDTACEYHASDGQIVGFYREAYTARWRVVDDTICYTYDGPESCQWMVVTDQGLLANYTTPDGALLTTSQVLRGNTCE